MSELIARLAIFTGGSAWNTFVNMTNNITNDLLYIIPVSDDGGSTSEIINTFGVKIYLLTSKDNNYF